MATQLVSDGAFLDYTPNSDVTAGDVIVLQDLVAIAPRDIAANTLGSVATKGVWRLPKNNSQAFSIGQKLYWDATNDVLTITATGNKLAGCAAAAAGASDTEGLVLLNVMVN